MLHFAPCVDTVTDYNFFDCFFLFETYTFPDNRLKRTNNCFVGFFSKKEMFSCWNERYFGYWKKILLPCGAQSGDKSEIMRPHNWSAFYWAADIAVKARTLLRTIPRKITNLCTCSLFNILMKAFGSQWRIHVAMALIYIHMEDYWFSHLKTYLTAATCPSPEKKIEKNHTKLK